MGRYFINPELKKSTMAILFLNILFLFAVLSVVQINNNNLKANYIKSLAAVTNKINNEDPKLLKDIIPITTKEVSEKEAKSGMIILKQYGLTPHLENQLFPYVNKTILYNTYFIIGIFVIMTAVFLIFNYAQYFYFYNNIRKITLAAKKVVEGDYDICINEDKEGDLAKLFTSFNSMQAIIRNNIDELNKEKHFLVDLLSDISHQLKTPLSSMFVYNDILLTKELTVEKSEFFLQNNKKQLYRMNWLIKSILKLARLDSKTIEFVKEPEDLNETIRNSIDTLTEEAEETTVIIKFKKGEKVIFNHDGSWLEEAFINIIKNAIEHSHKYGTINIQLTENPLYRRVEIEDNGEGISEEDLPNIFKRFYKAKNSKNSDSIGIGLALAKSIIEAHDGLIEVQSNVNIGTKFIITFLKY